MGKYIIKMMKDSISKIKNNLYCKIFGHRFISYEIRWWNTKYDKKIPIPSSWCINCGLSKKEIMNK